MKTADSLERERYHVWLEKFKAYLNPGAVVYDIGKSAKYDYAPMFAEYKYLTIDKDFNKKPDLVRDVEDVDDLIGINIPEAIICNGVVEQCENPFILFQNLFGLLEPEGIMLVGTVLTGFPVYDNDRFRFTEMGIKNTLKDYKLLESETIYRPEVKDPTYMYLLIQKTLEV